jgi:hypothetical protein
MQVDSGLDYVKVYPMQDTQGFSSHLASWAIIYMLVGMAARKKEMQQGLIRTQFVSE